MLVFLQPGFTAHDEIISAALINKDVHPSLRMMSSEPVLVEAVIAFIFDFVAPPCRIEVAKNPRQSTKG